MTPEEIRLSQIEDRYRTVQKYGDDIPNINDPIFVNLPRQTQIINDVRWLITRVKELEKNQQEVNDNFLMRKNKILHHLANL